MTDILTTTKNKESTVQDTYNTTPTQDRSEQYKIQDFIPDVQKLAQRLLQEQHFGQGFAFQNYYGTEYKTISNIKLANYIQDNNIDPNGAFITKNAAIQLGAQSSPYHAQGIVLATSFNQTQTNKPQTTHHTNEFIHLPQKPKHMLDLGQDIAHTALFVAQLQSANGVENKAKAYLLSASIASTISSILPKDKTYSIAYQNPEPKNTQEVQEVAQYLHENSDSLYDFLAQQNKLLIQAKYKIAPNPLVHAFDVHEISNALLSTYKEYAFAQNEQRHKTEHYLKKTKDRLAAGLGTVLFGAKNLESQNITVLLDSVNYENKTFTGHIADPHALAASEQIGFLAVEGKIKDFAGIQAFVREENIRNIATEQLIKDENSPFHQYSQNKMARLLNGKEKMQPAQQNYFKDTWDAINIHTPYEKSQQAASSINTRVDKNLARMQDFFNQHEQSKIVASITVGSVYDVIKNPQTNAITVKLDAISLNPIAYNHPDHLSNTAIQGDFIANLDIIPNNHHPKDDNAVTARLILNAIEQAEFSHVAKKGNKTVDPTNPLRQNYANTIAKHIVQATKQTKHPSHLTLSFFNAELKDGQEFRQNVALPNVVLQDFSEQGLQESFNLQSSEYRYLLQERKRLQEQSHKMIAQFFNDRSQNPNHITGRVLSEAELQEVYGINSKEFAQADTQTQHQIKYTSFVKERQIKAAQENPEIMSVLKQQAAIDKKIMEKEMTAVVLNDIASELSQAFLHENNTLAQFFADNKNKIHIKNLQGVERSSPIFEIGGGFALKDKSKRSGNENNPQHWFTQYEKEGNLGVCIMRGVSLCMDTAVFVGDFQSRYTPPKYYQGSGIKLTTEHSTIVAGIKQHGKTLDGKEQSIINEIVREAINPTSSTLIQGSFGVYSKQEGTQKSYVFAPEDSFLAKKTLNERYGTAMLHINPPPKTSLVGQNGAIGLGMLNNTQTFYPTQKTAKENVLVNKSNNEYTTLIYDNQPEHQNIVNHFAYKNTKAAQRQLQESQNTNIHEVDGKKILHHIDVRTVNGRDFAARDIAIDAICKQTGMTQGQGFGTSKCGVASDDIIKFAVDNIHTYLLNHGYHNNKPKIPYEKLYQNLFNEPLPKDPTQLPKDHNGLIQANPDTVNQDNMQRFFAGHQFGSNLICHFTLGEKQDAVHATLGQKSSTEHFGRMTMRDFNEDKQKGTKALDMQFTGALLMRIGGLNANIQETLQQARTQSTHLNPSKQSQYLSDAVSAMVSNQLLSSGKNSKSMAITAGGNFPSTFLTKRQVFLGANTHPENDPFQQLSNLIQVNAHNQIEVIGQY